MKQTLLNFYYNMLLVRKVQESIIFNYHPEDKMRCPMHLCLGQELTPSILGLLLKKNDSICYHHRSHNISNLIYVTFSELSLFFL